MNLKNGGDVYLAYIFKYEDVNSLSRLWNAKIEKAKYNKHKNQGTNIRRRVHSREVKHGEAKSAINILREIRMIATAMRNKITEYDIDYNSPETRAEAKRLLQFLDITNGAYLLKKYEKMNKL